MRKFLGTVAMIVIAIAVVGGMRNWFTVQKSDHGDSTEVHLLIDREKIRTDTAIARDIARELRENIGRKIEQKLDTTTTSSALSQPELEVPPALSMLPQRRPTHAGPNAGAASRTQVRRQVMAKY
ncbi:MAG: hypothetical protein ACYC3X_07050 [Pirellulaceae bacterium]